jgi:hypothetical protein
MGNPFCADMNERRAPNNPATPGRPFDSIFAENGVANGGKQKHNKYVVFDYSQVYAKYVVHLTEKPAPC